MSALLPPLRILERVGRVAPLGLRFWDVALGSFVPAGLQVRAFQPHAPERWIAATPTSAAVYAFARLPGLADVESFGLGDDPYWAQVRRRTWRIEVRDPAGCYLPVAFDAAAPARGLFADLCASSPLAASPPWLPAGSVPLFSSPARPVPAGMAALRATITDANGSPAAGALLAVGPPQGAGPNQSAPTLALADEQGRALAIFPVPAPEQTLPGSPPGSPPLAAARPLWEQGWTLTLSAAWSPPAPSSPDAAPALTDLCAALAQPAVAAAPTTAPLRYGVETVVRLELTT